MLGQGARQGLAAIDGGAHALGELRAAGMSAVGGDERQRAVERHAGADERGELRREQHQLARGEARAQRHARPCERAPRRRGRDLDGQAANRLKLRRGRALVGGDELALHFASGLAQRAIAEARHFTPLP